MRVVTHDPLTGRGGAVALPAGVEPPAVDLPLIEVRSDGRDYSIDIAKFGDVGTGYLFVALPLERGLFGDEPDFVPAGRFFWQCT